MKKLLIPFLFVSAVVCYMSCKKENNSDPALAKLEDTNARLMTANDSSHTDTTRTDSSCNGGGVIRDTVLPLTGDQIHITLSKIDTGSLSGLALAAITANTYPCRNNSLVAGLTNSGGDYALNFSGVIIPGPCAGGLINARATKVLFPVSDGAHVFKVVLNGSTYTGSFVKTGNQYTFTWPYTSGVTISPLTVN